MKQINTMDIDKKTREFIENKINKINLVYEQNGAQVFIHFERSGSKDLDYKSAAKVCVLKSNKTFIVHASEEVGNEAGTVFTRVWVDGVPKNDDIFYPYGIFTTNDKKPDTNIMQHIETILRRFEDKDPKNPKLAKIFKSYVPMEYHEIREQFETEKKTAKDTKKANEEIALMKAFANNMNGF